MKQFKRAAIFGIAAVLACSVGAFTACGDVPRGNDTPPQLYGVWTLDGSATDEGVTVEGHGKFTVVEGKDNAGIYCVAVLSEKITDASGSSITEHHIILADIAEDPQTKGRYALTDETALQWSASDGLSLVSVYGEESPLLYSALPDTTLPQGDYFGILEHDLAISFEIGDGTAACSSGENSFDIPLRRAGGYLSGNLDGQMCVFGEENGTLVAYLADEAGDEWSADRVSLIAGQLPEGPYHHFEEGVCTECDKPRQDGDVSYDYNYETSIVVTPARPDGKMYVERIEATSVEWDDASGQYVDQAVGNQGVLSGSFSAGGTYSYGTRTKTLSIESPAPGDAVKLKLKVKNGSPFAIKTQITLHCESSEFSALACSLENPLNRIGADAYSDWYTMSVSDDYTDLELVIRLPIDAAVQSMGLHFDIRISVSSVPINAHTVDGMPYETDAA